MSSEANEPRPSTDIPTEPSPADSRPSGVSLEGVSEKTDEPTPEPPRRGQRILIGSQRDPAAYRPKPPGDYIPVVDDTAGPPAEPRQTSPPEEPATAMEESRPLDAPLVEMPTEPSPLRQVVDEPTEPSPLPEVVDEPDKPSPLPEVVDEPTEPSPHPEAVDEPDEPVPAAPTGRFPPPNIRAKLPADLEAELEAAMAGSSLDELIDRDEAVTKQAALEPESKQTGRIVLIHREDVFVELGGREQGVVPLKQFAESPELEAEIEVVVTRFNPEEGLYDLTLPHAAADVGDWDDLEEGMVVEARVTGHNSGGLECEVNRLRGFIPISQISLYRVEDLAPFVDEKFLCVVTEANPQRRNLVLSRRAMLEREREEARRALLASLAPGQTHEGVVRKLMDFGAFVDIGGVDGLLHVSQLAWGRVSHPREVLSEGQTIKVRIEKYDPETGRISLAYRDMLENPWNDVQNRFPLNTQVQGKVTKLMEFGAFVELEPGIEGLVHVSELSHKRVWRVSDVVQEGQEVEVLVKSIDTKAQRIGLSMKDLLPEPERAKDKQESAEELEPAASKTRQQPTGPLKGGVGRSSGGEQFGLKW
jgi:small subunit ribosomal protein S1